MHPSHSVTFTIDGEHYCVPFTNEASAREYHHQVPRIYTTATNVILNTLNDTPLHKAEPDDNCEHYSMCKHCDKEIKRVPGGQGPTWVHEASGMVVGP